MDNGSNTYHERLLHWIWENRQFDIRNIRAVGGQQVHIFDTGSLNHSDGPDFQNACVQIGALRWYGDIEIHWNEHDWNHHGHQRDAHFNNVILHVVYHPCHKPAIKRADGTGIPTLYLKPLLVKPLRQFLQQFNRAKTLPCSGQFSYISQQAFHKQLEKAHHEYFEQKVADLMAFYDPGLPVFHAWKYMTALALFDGLGVSQNREPMQKLCKSLIPLLAETTSPQNFVSRAIAISAIGTPSQNNQLKWKHKGCRPNNHPSVRVKQAANLFWYFNKVSFKSYLKSDISTQWKRINAQPSLGKQQKDILFGTVWLPAIFILGNLMHAKKLKTRAFNEWDKHRVSIPKSLLRPLQSLSVPPKNYRTKLGTIHQLRSYCKPQNCEGCEVFKSVISA